ncbi:MAG TPA: gluconate 2-dehydrogenase subunit 3 family protein [Gemmatimonadaceae bacterium]|nr:gluconate 2-dehydrogenase subunit 3 family protein [Gemmatimonadaceae bacterium]
MSDVNRRDALKTFGMVSVASVLDVGTPHLERTVRAVESLQQGQPYVPKFFSRHEWQTVRVLVDYIIPRDERSGSATDAKVPEFMDYLLADREASENSKTSMRGGLAWLDTESRERFGVTFVAAADAQRRQILDDIAWPDKARPQMSHGVAFFNRMRDFTASGFFSSAIGWKDLQYIGNVFNPGWDGCPPAAMNKLGVNQDLMSSRVTIDK